MSINKSLKWLGKVVLAGIFAFLAMTLFCMGYYNVPIHYPNADGSTDYKWTPNKFYSKFTEGTANGRVNNDGFINIMDYTDGMDIDVLVMGSSHMEAMNVSMDESVTACLNEMISGKTAYNIGVSGHDFLTCCTNFDAALDHYNPADYVIFETSEINFTNDELNEVINKTLPEIADHSGGILGFLSKNQFLRCVYVQLQGFMNLEDEDREDVQLADSEEKSSENSSEALEKVLHSLSRTSAEHGVQLIIFYHPSTVINSDGSLRLVSKDAEKSLFSELCEKNGIIFLDMSERFKNEYETNHVLPYGFCNSSVGSGHLNKYGHKMIAEELFKIMY